MSLSNILGHCDSPSLSLGQEQGGLPLPTCSLVSNKCQVIFPHMVEMVSTEEKRKEVCAENVFTAAGLVRA